MRLILVLSLLILTSCSVKKQAEMIPYVLDLNVEESIYNEILRSKGNGKKVFFVEFMSDSMLKFSLLDIDNKEALITNRKLFINDKFYPIVFETDYFFNIGIKDSKPVVFNEDDKEIAMPTIKERKNNIGQYGYKKTVLIIDNSLYWIVNRKGELIKTNVSQ
ncbi:MAG: hypothetical protein LBE34_10290 [Flavobacteriaceae bacterium]|jgi:hypothetical protein|nr:hypothetical protein [Flavobacteriaceae bacterium]